MTITFEGPAVMVADIDASRAFYSDVLGQEVLADHGPHVAFKGGFSIWQADHAIGVVYDGTETRPSVLGQKNFELYFESPDLDESWTRVDGKWKDIIHPIHVAPWGQRGFRLHDPDGHIVEVGEPLPVLIKRLLNEGLSPEEVTERTSIPVEFVREVVKTI